MNPSNKDERSRYDMDPHDGGKAANHMKGMDFGEYFAVAWINAYIATFFQHATYR
jgi:hypothetical protein